MSITIIFTVNGTLSIERSVGYDIDGYRHPLACQLLEWTFLVPQLFLLIFSPFFFRRLGILGKLGWASAFVVLVWTIALMGRA